MKKYNAKNSKASSEPVETTDISNTLLSSNDHVGSKSTPRIMKERLLFHSKSEAIEYGAYIGLDVHKDTIAVAIAEPGRSEPLYEGEIANTSLKIAKLVGHLNKRYGYIPGTT
uniref:Transposase n=1 Tax=Candidatus Kentrum sp. SD TaxID=2126332 RepID=A0A450YIH9_9GAMM|nr:MAG: hypothetical protein BECKSD772F_GA0070984_10912 [Candidatus Kentron sp. SD]VFK47184.1 MAG: hypothetical protein BECKSD772E_GA0070983_10892 [Candidatus Kentron sp. SD]VFK81294.1 MAG: hypothetical protein BECKSD772D_GA0070982_12921 [Candidatus Kentron sp. SD]